MPLFLISFTVNFCHIPLKKKSYFKSVNTVYEIAVSSLSDFKNSFSDQKGLHQQGKTKIRLLEQTDEGLLSLLMGQACFESRH